MDSVLVKWWNDVSSQVCNINSYLQVNDSALTRAMSRPHWRQRELQAVRRFKTSRARSIVDVALTPSRFLDLNFCFVHGNPTLAEPRKTCNNHWIHAWFAQHWPSNFEGFDLACSNEKIPKLTVKCSNLFKTNFQNSFVIPVRTMPTATVAVRWHYHQAQGTRVADLCRKC